MTEEDLDEKGTMSFLEHLDDLRGTIVRSLLALVIGMLIMLPLTPYVMRLLMWPVKRIGLDPGTFLVNMETIGNLKVLLAVGFWGGLLLSIPFILYFIGCFIFPGLHPKEKKAVRFGSGFAGLLFFFGAGLGFFVSLPFFLQINLSIGEWMGGFQTDEIFIQDYVKTALRTVLAFGLSFELPMLVFILGYLGIVDSTQLREKRKHVLVGILVLAMFLTPPDVVTQVILTGPLFLLYELTVWLIWMKERREGTTDAGPPIDKKSLPAFFFLAVVGIGIVFFGSRLMNRGKTAPPKPEPAAITNPIDSEAIAESEAALLKEIGSISNLVNTLTSRIDTNDEQINTLSSTSLPAIQESLKALTKRVEALAKPAPQPAAPQFGPQPDPAGILR